MYVRARIVVVLSSDDDDGDEDGIAGDDGQDGRDGAGLWKEHRSLLLQAAALAQAALAEVESDPFAHLEGEPKRRETAEEWREPWRNSTLTSPST